MEALDEKLLLRYVLNYMAKDPIIKMFKSRKDVLNLQTIWH